MIDINESLVMEVQKSRQEGYIQYYLSDHCIDILGHSAVVAATMLYRTGAVVTSLTTPRHDTGATERGKVTRADWCSEYSVHSKMAAVLPHQGDIKIRCKSNLVFVALLHN